MAMVCSYLLGNINFCIWLACVKENNSTKYIQQQCRDACRRQWEEVEDGNIKKNKEKKRISVLLLYRFGYRIYLYWGYGCELNTCFILIYLCDTCYKSSDIHYTLLLMYYCTMLKVWLLNVCCCCIYVIKIC